MQCFVGDVNNSGEILRILKVHVTFYSIRTFDFRTPGYHHFVTNRKLCKCYHHHQIKLKLMDVGKKVQRSSYTRDINKSNIYCRKISGNPCLGWVHCHKNVS